MHLNFFLHVSYFWTEFSLFDDGFTLYKRTWVHYELSPNPTFSLYIFLIIFFFITIL